MIRLHHALEGTRAPLLTPLHLRCLLSTPQQLLPLLLHNCVDKRKLLPRVRRRNLCSLLDRALAERKGRVEEVIARRVAGREPAVDLGRLARLGPDARRPRLGEVHAAVLLGPVPAADGVRQPVLSHLALHDGLTDELGMVHLRAHAAGERHTQRTAFGGRLHALHGAAEFRRAALGGRNVSELAALLALLGLRVGGARPLVQTAANLGVPAGREVRGVGHLLGLGVRARRALSLRMPPGGKRNVEDLGDNDPEVLHLALVNLATFRVHRVQLVDEFGALVGPEVGEGDRVGVKGCLVDALDLREEGAHGEVDDALAEVAGEGGERPDVPGAEAEDPDGLLGEVALLGLGEELVDLGGEVGDGAGEGELVEDEVVVVAGRLLLLELAEYLLEGLVVVLVGGESLRGEADLGDEGVVGGAAELGHVSYTRIFGMIKQLTSSQNISVHPLTLPVTGVAISGDPKATTLTPPASLASSELRPNGDHDHFGALIRSDDDEVKNLPKTMRAKRASMTWMTKRGPPRSTRVEMKPSSVLRLRLQSNGLPPPRPDGEEGCRSWRGSSFDIVFAVSLCRFGVGDMALITGVFVGF